MAIFHIERGRIIDTPLPIVLCLLKNLDILDAVCVGGWNVQKISQHNFIFNKTGSKGSVNIIENEENSSSGSFNYMLNVKTWIGNLSWIMNLEYSQILSGKSSIMTTGNLQTSGLISLVLFFLKDKIRKSGDDIMAGLDRAGKLIMQNLKLAVSKLSSDQKTTLIRFISEIDNSARIISRKKPNFPKGMVQIIPIGKQSIVRVETNKPKVKRSFCLVNDGKGATEIVKQLGSFVNLANHFARENRFEPSHGYEVFPNGIDFYSRAIDIGQSLYRLYINDDVRSTLSSLLSYNKDVRLIVESEERDAMLPWEIMHNGEDFISLSTAFARTSAYTNSESSDDLLLRIKGLLVIASDPLGDLEFVKREAKAVTSAVEGIGSIHTELLTGADASKEKVIEAISSSRYQIIHYCGHSVFNRKNPRLSYLLFLNRRKLFVDEISRLCTENDIQLTFLNSCESAKGALPPSHMLGLLHAFVRAGTPSVVGMMWRIGDKGAFIFASSFYKMLAQGVHPTEAIRRARLKLGQYTDWRDPSWICPVLYIQ